MGLLRESSGASIEQVRASIVRVSLDVVLIVGVPAWLASVIASISDRVVKVAVFDTALLAWLFAIRFLPGLRWQTRAGQFVLLVHTVGAMLLFTLGPLGHGLMWLIGASVAAAAMLSQPHARLALAAQVVTSCIATWAFFTWPARSFALPMVRIGWIAFATSALAIGAGLVAAIGRILAQLTEALDALSRERAQLIEETERRARLEAELERRVETRTRDLALANSDLERFAHAVSHDLRSPLRTIDGFVALVQQDRDAVLDGESRELLARVRETTKRMADLVDALLFTARLGQVPIDRARVEISALARDVLRELRSGDRARQVECVVEDGLVAIAEPTLMRAVLENLLGNAWKFTSHHETAHIEVGAVPSGQPTFFVRDDGVGFDGASADRLFRDFRRLHSASRFPGTGVGLATAARIIQRHGGRIWAEAEIGRGATFYFTVPAGESVAAS